MENIFPCMKFENFAYFVFLPHYIIWRIRRVLKLKFQIATFGYVSREASVDDVIRAWELRTMASFTCWKKQKKLGTQVNIYFKFGSLRLNIALIKLRLLCYHGHASRYLTLNDKR